MAFIKILSVALPPILSDHLVWWIATAIVVLGMLAFGRDELRRLNWKRIWALSSVSFAESLRRKVLWITPLAILGVIAVSLLQHTADPQDSIRQTIKFCLFTSGLLVTVTAVVLACSSLPREIENRVIFTIVCKPTTRLEIVLGKVLGFVRLSGLIVLIMGAFTFAYLEWQNWRLNNQLVEKLRSENDPSIKQTLAKYQLTGLLSTKSVEQPIDLQIYQNVVDDSQPHWTTGNQGYYFAVPFEPSRQEKALLEAAAEDPPRGALMVINTMHLRRDKPTDEDKKWIDSRKLPIDGGIQFGPPIPGQTGIAKPVPQLSVKILDEKLNVLVPSDAINGGKLTSAPRSRPDGSGPNADGSYTIATLIPPEVVRRILDARRFYICIVPETPSVQYEVTTTPTVLDFIQNGAEHVIKPAGTTDPATGLPIVHFGSGTGRYGMQIVGDSKAKGSAAVFAFRDISVPSNIGDEVEFRFHGGIQRGADYDASKEFAAVGITIVNRTTHENSGLIEFHPETNRDSSVAVPSKFVMGGNFDVQIRGLDDSQWVGVQHNSVQFVSAQHSFVANLFKSLLILWLYSVLVVIVAIFTSTFLSWPIAMILTLLLLLGHWGVEQLGDALNPGVGRSVAVDLGFGRDAPNAKVVSASVEGLAKMLTAISTVLPDLSKFPVMDDITRGVSIPPRHILEALKVLACYGLPMLVLSFIILKNKEVAP